MQNLINVLKKEIFPISLILILAFARLIPHPPNFTPIIALAIMTGVPSLCSKITNKRNRLICNLCNSTWPTDGQSKIYSGADMCSGIPPVGLDLFLGHNDRPKRILAAGLHIRGVKVHASHRLAYHRGILFCTKCGSYTVKIVRGLKAECRMKPSDVQKDRVLKSMLRGKPPSGMTEWPTEVSEVPQFISPYLV